MLLLPVILASAFNSSAISTAPVLISERVRVRTPIIRKVEIRRPKAPVVPKVEPRRPKAIKPVGLGK